MQFIVLVCLFCLIILQQTINVTSLVSFTRNSINEIGRSFIARRLRAPLMGRSISATLNNDLDDINNNDDINDSIDVDKRRYGWSLLGRRKWVNPKRKGPLFG